MLKTSVKGLQLIDIDETGNTELSCLITHAAGLLILGMGYCSHSILVRGVYLDAEESGADAAVLPYFYIRYFIQVTHSQIFLGAPVKYPKFNALKIMQLDRILNTTQSSSNLVAIINTKCFIASY